jgi:hypothetical protein
MVQNTGKTVCTDTFKPVNRPEPIRVEENPLGLPMAIKGKQRLPIMGIEDRWRIDDEWWRKEPVSRLYFSVLLATGQRLVIYKDLIDLHWYRQSY